MSWDAKKNNIISTLEKLSSNLLSIYQVVELAPSEFDPQINNQIQQNSKQIQKQLKKLKNNEFHVAIVGLEKSGKSTFLNAWLGCDILPNQAERCTYTTTEIKSAKKQEEQRIELEYLSRQEFQAVVDQYEKQASGHGREAENAKKDLEEIKRFKSQLEPLVGRPPLIRHFEHLSQFVEPLHNYIATPYYSRAIKQATIYTTQITQRDGVVFHDVPGYDSPTQFHKQLAQKELAQADVIICVTNISNQVSITESLLAMLDVVDEEDPTIKASDKLFVFLNQADKTNNEKDLINRIESAQREWCDIHKKCQKDRMIAGSAAIHLMKTAEFTQEKTQQTLQGVGYRFTPEPQHGDGIHKFKEMIEYYFENDRIRVLENRCNILENNISELKKLILSKLHHQYPTDITQVDRTANSQFTIAFNRWFNEKWKSFEIEFPKYWNNQIVPSNWQDDITDTPEKIKILRQDYNEKLKTLSDKLLNQSTFEDSWIKTKHQVSDPTKANIDFRENIFSKFKHDAAEQLTETMVNTMFTMILNIENMIVQFFGVQEIKPWIVPGTDREKHRERLRHGLHTLFLRFARPLQHLLLDHPRGLPVRKNIIAKYNTEIQLLDLFYQKNLKEQDQHDLKTYLLSGSWPSKSINSKVQQPSVTSSRGFLDVLKKEETYQIEDAKPSQNVDETLRELREDAGVFVERLQYSVYPAASFEEFCMQELESIRSHIINNPETKMKISEILSEAACKDHPALSYLIQSSIKNAEITRRMVVALNELRSKG